MRGEVIEATVDHDRFRAGSEESVAESNEAVL